MEISSLRVFVKVAEIGNISQAAISLGLTQPSVSRIVRTLERHFGGPLFYRTGRGVALTEIGAFALPRARALLGNSDQLIADVKDLVRQPSGKVAIAMLPSITDDYGGELFHHINKELPNVSLRFLEGFSGQIEEWLADGRADIGLVSRYHSRFRGEGDILSRSHLVFVGAQGSFKRRGTTIPLKDIEGRPLIMPASPNSLRMAVDDAARRWQVKLNVVVEADSLLAQKQIILRNGYYAIMGAPAVAKELEQGILHGQALVKPSLPRLSVMLFTTCRPMSRSVREVARIIRSLFHS